MSAGELLYLRDGETIVQGYAIGTLERIATEPTDPPWLLFADERRCPFTLWFWASSPLTAAWLEP